MKLEFRLLVVDDEPNSIDAAIGILSDHLETKGFSLKQTAPKELSAGDLKNLVKREGRDYDLVIIDYNLGQDATNGSDVAASLRYQLPYTDIIFYSSDVSLNLLQELAKKDVAGVFVAHRPSLGDSLIGIADTIIGKAIDLNHMRGIAMAEVADIDVLMGECLETVFSSPSDEFRQVAADTLADLLERARKSAQTLEPICASGDILSIIEDSRLFSSSQKFWAMRRAARVLTDKPKAALAILNTYEQDVIAQRNTLAHAKDDEKEDGSLTLRSVRRGAEPTVIDDAWMAKFRTTLRSQRGAMIELCTALSSAARTT